VELHIDLNGRRDLSAQLYRQIRGAVLDGRLPRGTALPSSRELAGRLAVSRNTVTVAYDRLAAEGFVTGRPGAGTYVSVAVSPQRSGERAAAPFPIRAQWHAQADPADLSASCPRYDFRAGMPDASYFPFQTWRALVNRYLRRSATGSAAYADPAGHPGLRAAIAGHIGVSRGVPAVAGEVVVTNGTQQALDLLCRILVAPGDVVAIEDPGYPPAHRLFQCSGARVVSVPVDAEGLVVDALPAAARLVYVSPSHQFPLGTRMSLRRRLALLGWAQRTGAVVVEDDYDCEFRYAGRPIEPLRALDPGGRVVYVGSFSKTTLPTLRLGFCVAPRPVIAALRKAKYVVDWHTALPMQAALAGFIEAGLLARHIRRMRRVYEARRDRLVAGLDRDLAHHLEVIPPAAGLHLAALLRSGETEQERTVVKRAAAADVAVRALSDFAWSAPPRTGLLLGYGLIPVERIDEGIRRLAECFES
jgi:GntR family transcriptional regulator / MocR family aminotransferase